MAYDVADEKPPPEPFHDPEFQGAFAEAKALVNDLAAVLKSSDLHAQDGSGIKLRYEQCRELAQFECPSSRVVGLVGDSGVGKSSLVNSLLHMKNLAISSNEGEACTCVATEYHYHDRNDFLIKTDYFSFEEIKEQFTQLLQGYRQYHLHGDEVEGSERDDVKKSAERATDTFIAAFGQYFHAQQSSFLSSEEVAVNELLRLTQEYGPWRIQGLRGFERTATANTLEQCSRRLVSLTSQLATTNGEPALWPFIRKIKVYLNAHILSRGLVLVDLPGLRDLNTARVYITERYMLSCDEIFAVCCVGRAASDAGVKAVFDMAKRSGLSNVGIICTKSDDLEVEEARRSIEGRYSTQMTRISEDIARLSEAVSQMKHEVTFLEDERDTNGSLHEDDEERLRVVRRRQRTDEKELEDQQFRQKELCMNARNRRVTAKLRTQYNHISSGDLQVYCISNKIYRDNCSLPREQALRYIELTQVPALRKHCISMVAASKFRAAIIYMKDSIPALLGSVRLWIQSGDGNATLERRQKIQSAVNMVERILNEKLSSPTSSIIQLARLLRQLFDVRIHREMDTNTPTWIRAATNATMEWSGWHHSIYAAFCRQYGDYSSDKVDSDCWNREAMQSMTDQMKSPWRDFLQNVQRVQDDNAKLMSDCFEKALDALSPLRVNADGQVNQPVQTLISTLVHRDNVLTSEIERFFEELKQALSVLHADAFSGNRSSIVGQLMEATYHACNIDYGSGVDRRRKKLVSDRFSSDALFLSLRQQIRDKFVEAAKDTENKVKEVIEANLVSVRRDLDSLRDENIARESEVNPVFRERLREVTDRMELRMENVHETIRAFA